MKCRACDDILTDQESVKKDKHGNYLDMCYPCLRKSEFVDSDLDTLTDLIVNHHPTNFND